MAQASTTPPPASADMCPTEFDGDGSVTMWGQRIVGRGSFATVFRADLVDRSGTRAVVVKAFHTLVTPEREALLQREIHLWGQIGAHPRILRFLGRCRFGFRQSGIVSPYMRNGNMMEFIRKYPGRNRLPWLLHVAEGMKFLHENNFVHGDIKGTNVLINESGCALLADFGLSTFVERSQQATITYIRRKYAVAFAAPELVYGNASEVHGIMPETSADEPRSKTTFSDCFAFGRLVYEVHTGAQAWPGCDPLEIVGFITQGVTPDRLVAGDKYVPFHDRVWNLCKWCWATVPTARPNAARIVNEMNAV